MPKKKRKKRDEEKIDGINHFLRTQKLTIGQRAADIVTTLAGSWFFIITLGILLTIWMIINTSYLLFGSSWDPYPFILLNLCLSCLAAVQAPIILMSQNRAADRDRLKAEKDYMVNRKAERGIEEIQKDLKSIRNILRRRKK